MIYFLSAMNLFFLGREIYLYVQKKKKGKLFQVRSLRQDNQIMLFDDKGQITTFLEK
ncbi:hypothetical protein [Spongiimicrobium salis]|uniref:hypothetical protein n=1 Tax=Spongiimicrobium salis TaxID=1667022 RepID=UPI00374DDC62